MKFIKSTLPILFLFLLPTHLFAQWYKLPLPRWPNSWNIVSCPGGKPIPYDNIYPAGNGVIVYDFFCKGGSGGTLVVMESLNDLGIDTERFEQNGIGCCYENVMSSSSAINHAFITNQAGYPSLYYTPNDFSSITQMNAYFLLGSGYGPVAITKNYIYIASQTSYGPSDSLYINRTTISSNTYKYKSFYADSGTGKLYFVNDSTGFLLTYHRGANAPNLLVKTNDYGITWNTVFSSPTYNAKDYCFPTKDTGYLVLNDSAYKTTDGGISWNKLVVPGSSYRCIQFANGLIGYIGGMGGYLIKTVNGGTTWTTEISNTANTISSLYTFGPSVAYFVDSTMKIYKNQPGLDVAKIQSPISKFNLFPNPNEGVFTLDISSDLLNSECTIYDILGRPLYQANMVQEQTTINIPALAKGVYFMKLLSPSGQSLQKKFVKD